MSKKSYLSFENIANEIIINNKYKDLVNQNHHGLTRYDHSIRVAKKTYLITKKLNLDYVSATRAALLHDFFTDNDFKDISSFKKTKIHPKIASVNAQKYFNLNEKEKNAIETHMFPLNLKYSSSVEGIVLNVVDTSVAIYECSRFKLNAIFTIWILFIFNIITFTNN